MTTLNEFQLKAAMKLGSAGEFKTYLALLIHERGGIAGTSLTNLASVIGMNRGNVTRSMKGLQAAGLIRLVSKGDSATHVSTKYQIVKSANDPTPDPLYT